MKRTLNIEIVAGDATCAAVPGAFCPWVRVARFGTRWTCGLFDGRELVERSDEPQRGWLARLPECVAAEAT